MAINTKADWESTQSAFVLHSSRAFTSLLLCDDGGYAYGDEC